MKVDLEAIMYAPSASGTAPACQSESQRPAVSGDRMKSRETHDATCCRQPLCTAICTTEHGIVVLRVVGTSRSQMCQRRERPSAASLLVSYTMAAPFATNREWHNFGLFFGNAPARLPRGARRAATMIPHGSIGTEIPKQLREAQSVQEKTSISASPCVRTTGRFT